MDPPELVDKVLAEMLRTMSLAVPGHFSGKVVLVSLNRVEGYIPPVVVGVSFQGYASSWFLSLFLVTCVS